MKTNKFRVWDKLEKRFILPDKGYQGHYVLDLNGRFHNLQNGSGGDEYVVQQYIGMEDKDDVPIYEGDILENTTSYEEYCSPAVVAMSVYEEVQYSLYMKFRNPKPYHDALIREFNGITLWEEFPVSYFHKNNYKIIGNIFENPELLQK